jgi:ubiquitin-protein ligase
MTLRLRKEFFSDDWQEIDTKNASGKQKGPTFQASFAQDPSNSTTYLLEYVSNDRINWSIHTPRSAWYPGTHTGYLELPSYEPNYPFSPPKLVIETPIFSPNVLNGGVISVDILYLGWSPTYSLKKIMDLLAFMLVIDPVCPSDLNAKLPGIPLGFQLYSNEKIYRYYRTKGADAFMRATNFFARTYAQATVVPLMDPVVGPEDLEVSSTVIRELLEFFLEKNKLDTAPEGSTSNDPLIAFSEQMVLSRWRQEEQAWAKEINRSCKLLHPNVNMV